MRSRIACSRSERAHRRVGTARPCSKASRGKRGPAPCLKSPLSGFGACLGRKKEILCKRKCQCFAYTRALYSVTLGAVTKCVDGRDVDYTIEFCQIKNII